MANHTPMSSTLLPRVSSTNFVQKRKQRKRLIWIGITILAVLAIAAGVVVAILLTRKGGSSDVSSSGGSSGSPSSGGTSGGTSNNSGTSGKTGSKITMDDGTTFTYTNNFGGDWAADPKSPFAAGGKAQSWSPRVGSENWVWGTDMARGVNLG